MAIINYIPNVKTATGFDTLNTVSQFTNHVATGVFTNGDTYEINVPAPNDILTGQFVLIFVPDSDSIAGMKISINNGTAIPIDGVGAGSLQNGVATSLLVDVGAGVAYPYFKDVDLTANNLPLTTETANLYGLSGVDANVDKAITKVGAFVNLNYKAFTANGSFIVPSWVNSILVSGCASGGDGANSGAVSPKAGEFILNKPFNVTPGQSLTIVCGTGNTTITELGIILVANSITTNHPNDKLGFAPSNGIYGGTPGTYISGQVPAGDGANEVGGFKYPELFSNYIKSLGGGTGIYKGGNGGILGGGGGGPTSEGRTAGAGGGLCMTGGTGAGPGGAGGIGGAFGCGGGGGAGTTTGCGGGAGGFGAGGGNGGGGTGVGGKGSPGFILIEW